MTKNRERSTTRKIIAKPVRVEFKLKSGETASVKAIRTLERTARKRRTRAKGR